MRTGIRVIFVISRLSDDVTDGRNPITTTQGVINNAAGDTCSAALGDVSYCFESFLSSSKSVFTSVAQGEIEGPNCRCFGYGRRDR